MATAHPFDCTEAKVRECLKSGRVELLRTWAWPTAQVRLSLNQPEGAAEPRLTVLYSQSKAKAHAAAADAL
jgi:hypothetical protein